MKPSVSVHSLHSAGVPLGNAAVKRARGATGTKNAESFLESTRFLNSAQGEWGCLQKKGFILGWPEDRR